MNRRVHHGMTGLAILVAMFLAIGTGGVAHADGPSAIATAAPSASSQLSPTGAALHVIVDAGSLTDLRWPSFGNYRDQVKSFYDSDGYTLAWVKNGQPTPQAIAITEVLSQADSKGLNAEDYDGPRWAGRLAQLHQSGAPPSDADFAKFDVDMTVCTMRYVSNLHTGRVNPKSLGLGLDVDGRQYDLSRFLRERLINASPTDLQTGLVSIEPPFDAYRRLEATLPIYQVLAARDGGGTLPAVSKSVRPGDTYRGVPRLASFLKLIGDLPADAAVSIDPPIYQQPLVDAVKKFQRRHGLDTDGRLGAQTIKQLNIPLSQRVEQIKLAMERWRWVPHHFSHPPIIVNIPEFILRAWDENAHNVLQMNVIVGKAYHHKTPVFTGDMRYLIFRPYWDVPTDIARAEMVPKIERDPDYLSKNNLEVAAGDGTVVTDGAVSDDALDEIESGAVQVRQKPGPKNALGLVKFIFPNDYSVYLHSTDAPELFSRSERDFSHGCIRVQNPEGLADWVLRDQPEWTKERIEAAMTSGEDNRRVNLTKPIPVLILYATAAVRISNEVQFYGDIYGYDSELEEALAKDYSQ